MSSAHLLARIGQLRSLSTSSRRLGHAVNLDTLPQKSRDIIKREKLVTCNNYSALPAVLCAGKGVFLYDVDGNKYYDYLSGYSSVNQGHCHPKIIDALVKQVTVLHHTSRAFHSDLLVEYAEFLTQLFGYVSGLCDCFVFCECILKFEDLIYSGNIA
jgi:acetylornithine/succinyldiaminopimelate/putrescine aminotransferase